MLIALVALGLSAPDYMVQPYYLYPSDQPYHAEYAATAEKVAKDIQAWYLEKTGVTFRLKPLLVKRSPMTYLEMRAGKTPSDEARSDKTKMPFWWEGVERAIGVWKAKEVTWVFAQGGGGYAAANLIGDYAGIGMFGDWVLEPISGVREPAAITADMATWQVKGGVPMGTTAHELGHAFGVHHPDEYPGKSIMRWHGDYPDTGFLPHEILILKNSPFFVKDAFDARAPWLDFENQDAMRWGERVTLRGRGFAKGDTIEIVTVDGTRTLVPSEVSAGAVVVTIPEGVGPGFVRSRRGALRGNGVPVNFYPPKAPGK
ncbi:MAG: hypothetical protein KIS66_07360 [Fimbriimonadaceae bacterium]|nr:hypothetical protein [Fimbriimonadaceae bacterium]